MAHDEPQAAGPTKLVIRNIGLLLSGAMEMPILDAFNSPLKIDQIWLPDLTLNNNFKEVARFDHCTILPRGATLREFSFR